MFPIAPCSGAALDVVFGVATLVVLYALGAESLGANVRVHHGALGMVRALFVARMRGKEAVALGFLHPALVCLLPFVIVRFVHAAHLQGYLAALSSGFYAALQINGLSVILTDKYLQCKYLRSWIPATKQYSASTFPTWAR